MAPFLHNDRVVSLELTIETTCTGTVLHIAGELLTTAAPELEKACGKVARPLSVDLSSLTVGDSNGIKALKRLEKGGVSLTGQSHRISLLLAHASTV